MKRAYLATSYTWKSPLKKLPLIGKMLGRFVEYIRFIRVSKCTATLLERTGWNIFSPITHSHIIPRWIPERLNTHTFWLGLDFDWISACDEMWIFCQPGWKESYGVGEEAMLAGNDLGMKIRYINRKHEFINPATGNVIMGPEIYEHPKDVHTGPDAVT